MNWTRGKTIGRGSSATVSAATCHNSGETIAVKSVESHNSRFLQREAEILSSLNSPYIIKYRGCDTFNLLMEYAPYGTLTDVATAAKKKNGGFLEEALVVKYTRQILLGLAYVHSKGIAHCDIKGSNVLIGENGDAKIADFGCAKSIKPKITEPIRGTPAYMAPEVARGERQGKESDIWAVGCMVIEMFKGDYSPLWIGSDPDPVSVLYRVGFLGESPEVPCWVTEQGKDFLGKCLKREVKERWTASQLLNHPFLITKSNSEPVLVTNSPTSVMDQILWRLEDDDELDCHEDERIRVLSCIGHTWDDEDWINVRRYNEGRNIV